jgi:hypothetical protein
MKMNVKKFLGLAAVAGLLAIVAPAASQALSLANPGSAVTAQHASEAITTEVRWGRRRGGWGRPHYRRHYGWRPHRWHRRGW